MQFFHKTINYALVVLSLSFTVSENLFAESENSDIANVAVLMLEVSGGVPETYAASLTDRLRQELFQTGAFNVMERAEMNAILKEIGFQQTGCTSNECVVQAGRILGASDMIAGSVSKMGELHTVTLRVIDVESSEIKKMVTVDCLCPIEEVLTIRLREAAKKIAGTAENRLIPNSDQMIGKGNIRILSSPANAKVFFDGNKTDFTTPVILEDISSGIHTIRLEFGILVGSIQIFVVPNVTIEVDIPMKTGYGSLHINSNPQSAKTYLDGKYIGVTPVTIDTVLAGFRQLTLKHENNYGRFLGLSLKLNQHLDLDVELHQHDYEISVTKIYSNSSFSFVYIPQGVLKKGLKHKSIDSFYLQVHEMTQNQWRLLMKSNPAKDRGDLKPIVNVSYNDVLKFISILNESVDSVSFRLPTRYEWEYACRAGNKNKEIFNDNKELDEHVWYADNSLGCIHDIGLKAPNAWGLYDMNGNAWEWCYRQKGERLEQYVYIMGGAYDSKRKKVLRLSTKYQSITSYPENIGFRLVMEKK